MWLNCFINFSIVILRNVIDLVFDPFKLGMIQCLRMGLLIPNDESV